MEMNEQELSVVVAEVKDGNKYAEIVTSSDLDKAGVYLKFVNAKVKELNDARLSMTRPLDDSKKQIMAMFSTPIESLKAVSDEIKKTITTYQLKIEAIRLEVEAKLKAEAEAKAEAERKEAMDRAEELEGQGHIDGAEDVLDAAVEIVAKEVVVPEIRTKPTGVSMRTNWKSKVVDTALVPRKYMMVDEVALGKAVREHNVGNKDAASRVEIPGVEIYAEKSMY